MNVFNINFNKFLQSILYIEKKNSYTVKESSLNINSTWNL